MSKLILTVLCLVAVVYCSSHSEAPGTSKRPNADVTDVYAFRSYETGREDYVTIIANFYGLQDPFGGPNYFSFSDGHFYEIYIDNDGDSVEDLTFQMFGGASLSGPTVSSPYVIDEDQCLSPYARSVPSSINQQTRGGISLNIGGKTVPVALKFVGPISSGNIGNLNWNEYYYLNLIQGNRNNNPTAIKVDGTSNTKFTKPFDNAGSKTFSNYEAYANDYIYDIDIPNCNTAGRVFVGQRSESFAVNLGPTFDLVNYIPIPGFPGAIDDSVENNQIRFKNIDTIALELPIHCVTSDDTDVIGVWVGTRELLHEGNDHIPGRQFSRLGFPLINELLIGLRDKGLYSRSHPKDDLKNKFDTYIKYPTFPEILSILFKDAVGSDDSLAPSNFPRLDLYTAIMTGVPGLNKPIDDVVPSDILRLNVTVEPKAAANQERFGVLSNDASGFPNGRRPGDDVVDIILRVAMGRLCTGDFQQLGACTEDQAPVGTVDLLDGAYIDANQFQEVFPYLNTPLGGDFSYCDRK